jgi:hypothetical protein
LTSGSGADINGLAIRGAREREEEKRILAQEPERVRDKTKYPFQVDFIGLHTATHEYQVCSLKLLTSLDVHVISFRLL